MTYARIYDSLIARAQHRTLEGYVEKHHIIPKCLGGDNSKSNIVRLTAEEHFVAHLVLTKMHPTVHYLSVAVLLMRGRKTKRFVKNSRFYAKLRAKAAEASKRENRSEETLRKLADAARNMSLEQREKLAAAQRGRKASAETKRKLSEAGKGRTHTEEAKAKMRGPRDESPETKSRRSKAKLGFKHSSESKAKMTASHLVRAPMSEETKKKIGKASKGRKLTQEHKDCISLANLGKVSPLRGIPRTDETKRRISEMRKGKVNSPDSIERMKATKARNHFLQSPRSGLLTHWATV